MNNPDPDAHASWFALNADSALIGSLEIITGLSVLVNPARLIGVYGYMPPLAYVWLTGYVVAGVMLLYALRRRLVVAEVHSRVFLVAANVLSLGFAFLELGTGAVARDFLISAVIVWTMVLRCKALLRGGVFVVPRWTRRH